MLTITDYKPYKRAVRGRVGVRADFRVKPVPKEGVVYQKVTSRYTLGGRARTYQFTEAWRVGKRRRETGRIEQNGTDSFELCGAKAVAHIAANGPTVPMFKCAAFYNMHAPYECLER